MVGRTLGHFRFIDKLGEGGMGEVYRVKDTHLDRQVAIKVLPEVFTNAPGRLSRFKREAKLLAILNHPHIAQVHSFEEVDGCKLLVMELVGGETLAERIAKGPILLGDSVRIALEIAQGLEAAHERGIIHRDLKPANIKLTLDGEVKILDFGLAKPIPGAFSGASQLPTLTLAPTETGVVVGTFAYMSPEQARGEEVDKRADIWAFGVVLWEMLTGKRPFDGDAAEPDWQSLPAETPYGVQKLLKHCLNRNPKDRLHDITDARLELEEALEPEVAFGKATSRVQRWRQGLPWLATLIAVIVSVAAFWFLKPQPNSEPGLPLRAEVLLPEGEGLASHYRHGLALSPDGRLLAFVSGILPDSIRGPAPEQAQIYLRRVAGWQARPLGGTARSTQPVFSPDGKWLAFTSMRASLLQKVPIKGGKPETICECDARFGASWGPDDTIVFAGPNGGLHRVSAMGGKPEVLTHLDEEAGEFSHRLPHFLPRGEAVLYTAVGDFQTADATVYAEFYARSVMVHSLTTGASKPLLQDAADARFIDSGHLVFARRGRLLAASFDPRSLQFVGPVVPVLDGVSHSVLSGHLNRDTGAAQFSVSTSGLLAYAKGSVAPEYKSGLVLADRAGMESTIEIEEKAYLSARVSPDGHRVLLGTSYPPWAVWLLDLGRGSLTRQTFYGVPSFPIWGPGPGHFTFLEGQRLLIKRVGSGPGETETLSTGLRAEPSSWSPDGQHLAAATEHENDILIVSRSGEVKPFLQTEFSEAYPDFSPDGRWLAYVSNQSGRKELYARPFPGPGPAIQISTTGGSRPVWSRDGREILYRWSGKFFAVEIREVDGLLVPGEPIVLFEGSYTRSAPVRSYDLAPDGRLLLLRPANEDQLAAEVDTLMPDRIRLVHNWFTELEQTAPTGKRP